MCLFHHDGSCIFCKRLLPPALLLMLHLSKLLDLNNEVIVIQFQNLDMANKNVSLQIDVTNYSTNSTAATSSQDQSWDTTSYALAQAGYQLLYVRYVRIQANQEFLQYS